MYFLRNNSEQNVYEWTYEEELKFKNIIENIYKMYVKKKPLMHY